MSWLNDNPKPMPWPVGLVVKKGVNKLARMAAGTPLPLSRMAISISWLRERLFTLSRGVKPPPQHVRLKEILVNAKVKGKMIFSAAAALANRRPVIPASG